MLNYSLNSNPTLTTLSRLEASILNQQRRLRFGQPTINYSINSLQLEQIPSGLPAQLTNPGSKCMHLSGCGFYQMLTYSVWQFLLTDRCQQKNEIITKIRKLIVHKEFMQSSPSTKGLIVKGIKQMHDFIQLSTVNNPVAHCMWKTDSMLAFTEFWKSLLARQSVKNIINAEETANLQKSVFQLLAQFLQISFTIYYQSGPIQFQKEHYQPSSTTNKLLTLSLLIYSKKAQSRQILRDSRSKLVETQSLIDNPSVLESLQWEYVIFSQKKPKVNPSHSQLSREDISQINKVDESVQQEKQELIKLFKLKTKSELNLQRLGDDLHNQKDEVLSPIYSSHIRDNTNQKQGLSTTRTKKSAVTTAGGDGKYCGLKKSTFIEDKGDFEQTQIHLQNIRANMMKGEKLIGDMKQFCAKIMV